MSGEKTEQPTPKRLRDSREKGEVAHSRDFTQTALICALFRALSDQCPVHSRIAASADTGAGGLCRPGVRRRIGARADGNPRSGRPRARSADSHRAWGGDVRRIPAGRRRAGVSKLKPSAEKLNPAGNLKNIFSARNLMEFIKSVCKILFLAVLVTLVIRDSLQPLMAVPHSGLDGLRTGVGRILQGHGLEHPDWRTGRFRWRTWLGSVTSIAKGLRMSKDEVKQEYKEMEGDPHIKQQRKHLHQELIIDAAHENGGQRFQRLSR